MDDYARDASEVPCAKGKVGRRIHAKGYRNIRALRERAT